MCKPKMPKQTNKGVIAPDYVRNPLLDETRSAAGAYFAARQGRNSLRIQLGGAARAAGPNAPGTPATAPATTAAPSPAAINPTPAQRFGIAGARMVLAQR